MSSLDWLKQRLGRETIPIHWSWRFGGMDASGDPCALCGQERGTHNATHVFQESLPAPQPETAARESIAQAYMRLRAQKEKTK